MAENLQDATFGEIASKSKYLGIIIDGYWKVAKVSKFVKNKNVHCLLQNIYNGKELVVDWRTMKKIIEGKASVSKVLRRKFYKRAKGNWKWN